MTTRPTASHPSASPSTTKPPTAWLAAPPDVLDDDPLVTTVMTTHAVAIAAEARTPTALHLMATAGVRHLPVVDRDRCVGMLVEADLIRCLAQAPGPLGAAVTFTVVELRRPALELPPTARASDAARQMSLDVADAVLVTANGRIRRRSRRPMACRGVSMVPAANRPCPSDTSGLRPGRVPVVARRGRMRCWPDHRHRNRCVQDALQSDRAEHGAPEGAPSAVSDDQQVRVPGLRHEYMSRRTPERTDLDRDVRYGAATRPDHLVDHVPRDLFDIGA
jgi:CBS domain-containing protein